MGASIKTANKAGGQGEGGPTKVSVFLISASATLFGITILGRLMSLSFKNRTSAQFSQSEKVNQSQILAAGDLGVNTLPVSFPSDLPVYPKSKLKNSWRVQGSKVEAISVVWEVDEPVKKVINYYKKEFKQLGWDTIYVKDSENSFTLSFRKDEAEGFMGIIKGEGNVVISVTVGVK